MVVCFQKSKISQHSVYQIDAEFLLNKLSFRNADSLQKKVQ